MRINVHSKPKHYLQSLGISEQISRQESCMVHKYIRLFTASLFIGVWAPSNLGAATFLPEKIMQCPKGWGLKSGCKHRRSPFSHLMKLLSLEK